MGIEQSTAKQAQPSSEKFPRKSSRGRTTKSAYVLASETDIEGRNSPGPSVISEPDVPYVPYTVHRPISSGDSPLLHRKHQIPVLTNLRRSRSETRQPESKISGKKGGIITVSKPSLLERSISETDLSRLQALPLLPPIIRNSTSSSYSRDPDILHSLDTPAWQKIALAYEGLLRKSSHGVAAEQSRLGVNIRQVDDRISSVIHQFSERQKTYARAAERFARMGEINHTLSKCEISIKFINELALELNSLLPEDERLEPFVWSSG